MKISFIIPTYNAAEYIEECLNSIFALDLQGHEREIIVVNDGSKDETSALLDEYSKTHRIIVISQKNQGLSSARNAAIDASSGVYIGFVDADDRLQNADMTDVLTYMKQGVDIIGVNMTEVKKDGSRHPYRRYSPQYNKVYRGAREFMRGRNLMPCAVAYLYSRELLNARNLRFLPGVYHEDEDFTPRAFAVAESFVATDTDLYEYVSHKESITTTTDQTKQQKKFRDIVHILEGLTDYCKSDKDIKECMQYKLDYLTVDILTLLLRDKQPKDFQKDIITKLRSLGYFPLNWHSNWKHILFNLYTRIKFSL